MSWWHSALLKSLVCAAIGTGWLGGDILDGQETATPAEGSSRQKQWLVTVDGDRVEIRGPWKIEGGRVLFTNPRGTLSSMRLSQLDLAASEELRQAPRGSTNPTQRPSTSAGEAVLVLETKDVARWDGTMAASEAAPTPELGSESGGEPVSNRALPATPASSSAQTPSGSGASASEKAPPTGSSSTAGSQSPASKSTTSKVVVASFRDLGNYDEGVKIYGTLRNDGDVRAMRVTALVKVLDEAGNELAQQRVEPRQNQIPTGETSNFRAFFPDIRVYGKVEIEVTSDA